MKWSPSLLTYSEHPITKKRRSIITVEKYLVNIFEAYHWFMNKLSQMETLHLIQTVHGHRKSSHQLSKVDKILSYDVRLLDTVLDHMV